MTTPRVVVPLYIEKTATDFRAWGSGILYQYRGRPCLISAAHVSDGDGVTQNIMAVGADGKMHTLPNAVVQTVIPVSGTRLDDKFDLVVMILDDNLAGQFQAMGFEFLPESSLITREATRLDRLIFLGFPFNRQDCVSSDEGTWIHAQPTATHTYLISPVIATAMGFSTDSHLVLAYKVSRAQPLEGQASDAPMPPGLSGGAVLLFEDNLFGFIGVVTRWIDPGYIIATRSILTVPLLARATQDAVNTNNEINSPTP